MASVLRSLAIKGLSRHDIEAKKGKLLEAKPRTRGADCTRALRFQSFQSFESFEYYCQMERPKL